MKISVARATNDRLLDVVERLAALPQGNLRLRLKIGGRRHQEILLDPVRGDGEAVTGEIEERDVGALARRGKIGQRLFEAVEVDVGLHGDRKADAFETLADESGVDDGVLKRGVGIGAVGDDERDQTAGRGRHG
jgi:hypothetical protein